MASGMGVYGKRNGSLLETESEHKVSGMGVFKLAEWELEMY